MKKGAETLGRILIRTNTAFFTGLGFMILALLLANGGPTAAWILPVFGVVGMVSSFGGIIYAFAYFRCPHCGASLMPGGRLPMSVPAYCSHCGVKLNENE